MSLTNLYIGLKSRLGIRRGHHRLHPLLLDLDGRCYKIGLVKIANDHPGKQLHAIDGQFGGLFDRRHADLGFCRLHPAEPRRAACPIPVMLAWVFFLAVLGVTMAIPMKRQMINIEQLRFPSGIAAAETLRALHSHGDKAMRSAKALGIAGVLAGISQFWTDAELLDNHSPRALARPLFARQRLVKTVQRVDLRQGVDRTAPCCFGWEPIFIAAGAMTGMRVSVSMMLGGTLCWAVFVPIIQQHGVITDAKTTTRASWNGPSGAAPPAWSLPACSRSPCSGEA